MDEKIFVLEDDTFLRDGLCEFLGKEGYRVTAADSVAAASELTSGSAYNLIILDVMLPDGNGFDFCSSLRSKGVSTPVLFLTACDDEIQVVRGLDSGADDYVTKPFKLLELMSRVRALLRRGGSSGVNSMDLKIDFNNMTVKKNGESLFLTRTEFLILSQLIRNNGVIVTRDALLRNIWDDGDKYIDDNTLSVHIKRLRDKIGGSRIATVRGIGYRWEVKE